MTLPRLKTYASDTGRIYEYYFVEKRTTARFGAAIEYVYNVSSDRRSVFPVSIFVLDEAVADWAEHHGRPLNDSERYVAARLALQRAFDEIEDLQHSGDPVTPSVLAFGPAGAELQVDAKRLEELLAPLDL